MKCAAFLISAVESHLAGTSFIILYNQVYCSRFHSRLYKKRIKLTDSQIDRQTDIKLKVAKIPWLLLFAKDVKMQSLSIKYHNNDDKDDLFFLAGCPFFSKQLQ